LRELFVSAPPSGTRSRAAMGSAAVRGGGSPPHATPPCPNALQRPRWERERCSLPTSATDSRHAHLTDSSTPEVATRFREIHHVRWRRAPADDPGHDVFDDTPRASAAMRCTRPPMRRARMPPDPAGLPIDIEPTGDTPRPRCCLPRTGRTTRPLTPLSRCASTEVRHAPPGSPSPPTRSKSAIPAAQGAFPRRVPARPTRLREAASNADPPPIPRLCRLGPASDALSPHAPGGGGARQGRFRAFITPGRTVPRAARRLLQSKQSASTTNGPSKPRSPVRPLDFHRAPYLGAGPARGVEWPREQSPFRRSGAEDSRVRGRLSSGGLAPSAPASFTSIARGERFAPTRSTLGHLSSHRPIACRLESPSCARMGQRAFDSLAGPKVRPRSRLRGFLGCQRALARRWTGPPPAPLREEEMRSAAPEVPSIERPPFRGVPFSTACHQPVE